MDRNIFRNGLNEIYSFFGRKMPDDRICESIFRRVKSLPDDFMNFVITHFTVQETLPRNMGYYLLRVLWPEYLNKNPDLQAHENKCCPLCIPELPGWRRVWGTEKTGWGDIVHVPLEVRCTCGNARNPRNEPIFSEYELLAKGLFLENPDKDKFTEQRERWNKSEWKKVVGLQPETSEAHKEYKEEFVEEEF